MTKRTSSRKNSFCSVRISNGNVFSSAMVSRSGFHFLRFGSCFFDGTDHVERLLGQVVVLAVEDFLEAADGVRDADVFAGDARELFRNEVWLRQEPLDFTGPRDRQLVFFA